MQWWTYGTGGAAVIALVSAGAVVTQVRHRRRHRALIEESIGVLCATDSADTAGWAAVRESVAALTAQEALADRLDRELPARLRAGIATAADRALVEAIRSDVTRSDDDEGVAPRPRPAIDAVPRVGDVVDLPDMFRSVETNLRQRLRTARIVLGQADRLAVGPEECRRQLITTVDDLDRVADAAAARGKRDPLGALAMLTAPESVLPETGVPGQGGRRATERHVLVLEHAGIDHRLALRMWCTEALTQMTASADVNGRPR